MPVIVLEARDFTSPLFLVRTWEALSGCTTFSLVASLGSSELAKDTPHFKTFWIFCMFIWCFFFTLTLLIHILSVIQFHSLIPISWKNLTVTVAVLGALMSLSAFVVFLCFLMDHQWMRPRPVAAAVAAGLTFIAYTSESFILVTQAKEHRGYLGSMPGVLKVFQLWGGCHMIPLLVVAFHSAPSGDQEWQLWVRCASYGVCALTSLLTLAVIIGDLAGRCLLPFDRFLAVFSLSGVLLYTVATVLCFTAVLRVRSPPERAAKPSAELAIMEAAVASVTLLAYTVDLAFSVKLLCDRSRA